MNKIRELVKLYESHLRADHPLKESATQMVFGSGHVDSRLMFVGEAPGQKEDETGQPFVGRAGQVLEACLNDIGLRRSEVYITNVVKYRPPGNRDPHPDEIAAGGSVLESQINIIQPELVCTLGNFALRYMCGDDKSISKVHGNIIMGSAHRFSSVGVAVFPLYHPAAALRNPAIMNALKEDFQKLKGEL